MQMKVLSLMKNCYCLQIKDMNDGVAVLVKAKWRIISVQKFTVVFKILLSKKQPLTNLKKPLDVH